MSFDVLPDELLCQIAHTSAALFHSKDGLYGDDLNYAAFSDQQICCEYFRLSPLASSNRRMRRICFPIIFSRVVLLGMTESGDDELPLDRALKLLHRIISRRTDIAWHVKSMKGHRRDPPKLYADAWIGVLSPVLKILPNLVSIYNFHVYLDEQFIRLINDCPHLQKLDFRGCYDQVCCSAWAGYDLPADSPANFLAKVNLDTLSISESMDITPRSLVTSNLSYLSSTLDLGLRISNLTLYPTCKEIQGIFSQLRLPPGQVGRICLYMGSSDASREKRLELLHEVENMLTSVPIHELQYPIPEIELSSIALRPGIPGLGYNYLPLMPELNLRETGLNVDSYVIRRSPGTEAAMSAESATNIWARGWSVVEMNVEWYDWEATAAACFSSQVPALERLTVVGWAEPHDRMVITPAITRRLAVAMGFLPCLTKLSIWGEYKNPLILTDSSPNPQELDSLEVYRYAVDMLVNALHDCAPALEMIEFSHRSGRYR